MNKFQILFVILALIFLFNLYFLGKDKPTQGSHIPLGEHEDDSDEHQSPDEAPTIPAPAVSVVIPLYNQLRYLQDAVDSVINQQFKDWELIIVDDGSTEWSTKTALENIKQTYSDKRIELVFKTNGGLSDARNAGIAKAKGTWVLPLDADDMIDSTFLEKAINLAKRDPEVNLVISNLVGFDADDPTQIVSQWIVPPWNPLELPKTNLLHCCPLYKKALWETVKGYSPAMLFGWEDWDFWIRVNQVTQIKPEIIREDLLKYRIKAGMHSFCKDYQSLCNSMLQTMHPHLHSKQDVLYSHQTIATYKRILEEPISNRLSASCDVSQLHLWRGIIRERDGKLQDALLDYEQAKRLADWKDWQPQLRIALLKRHLGKLEEVKVAKDILDDLFDHFPGLREAVAIVFGPQQNAQD